MNNWSAKSKKINIVSIISSPWLLAITPSIVIILLLPNIVFPYALSLKKTSDYRKNKQLTFFEDLDLNGIKDRIEILDHRGKFACCYIYTNNASLKRQFNFYGKVPQQENLTMPVFCDVNSDGIKEIFVFSQKEDSLFINAVDISKQKVILNGRFISKIGMIPNLKDFVLRPIINYDNNNDGIPEIYFLLNGCYSLYPRKIMAYDYKNDHIFSTINTGSQHYVTPFKSEDNKLFFISTTPATDNCPTDFKYPYTDSCAWILGFNDKLELLFKPKPFSGRGCTVHGPTIVKDQFHYSIFNQGKKHANFSIVTNLFGKIRDKKNIPPSVNKGNIIEITQQKKIHYLLRASEDNLFNVFEYNPSQMEYEQTKFTEKLQNSSLLPFNLHDEKIAYFATNYKNNTTSLFLNNLQQELSFNTELYIKFFNLYAQTKKVHNGILLMVTDRESLFTYLITKNKYYPLRFVFFLLIYLLNVAFALLSLYLYKTQSNKRDTLKKEIISLQLKLINSQLDPHFAFNSLNLVSSKILKGERHEAYDLMICFANMMRSAMSSSDNISWSLEQELKFVTSYLSLMKVRFNTLFEFKINYDKVNNLNKIFISRLLIQNSVENSIKHAFKNISYTGLIKINITEKADHIEIMISDNGIGRQNTLHNDENNDSGNGLKWSKKQVEIYNKLLKTNICFKIKDLKNNTVPCGTRTIITIPQ